MVDESYATVGSAEEWLEVHRAEWSPNTVRGYSTALAQWWSFLEQRGEADAWDEVGVPAVAFLSWLRNGGTVEHVIAAPEDSPSEGTLAARLAAVISFYRWQAAVYDVPVAKRLLKGAPRRAPARALLSHLDSGSAPAASSLVRVRRTRRRDRPPILLPQQVQAILDGCAVYDAGTGEWVGNLRDRLLFALLAETGCRLGEALGMRISDFVMGCGGTPYAEIVPRDGNPNEARVKMMRARRVYVGTDLERLLADYLCHLACRAAGLGMPVTGDDALLVNLDRPPFLAALSAGTVRDKVSALKRRKIGPARMDASLVPAYSCLRTAAGGHARLGGLPPPRACPRADHAGPLWVSEDEALRSAANWKTFTAGWQAGHDR